jgi:hypothetical protein
MYRVAVGGDVDDDDNDDDDSNDKAEVEDEEGGGEGFEDACEGEDDAGRFRDSAAVDGIDDECSSAAVSGDSAAVNGETTG